MPLIDERGRVFGRFNAVDAFVAALVLVMLPIAYAAFLLFRTPPAKLTDVEPKQLTMGPNLRVKISGTNLRPFMRVSFDTVQGRTFMIGSTSSAEVDLPNLEPGTYDVVLYDYAQEVDRLPKAFTMLPRTPAPSVTVSVAGAFVGMGEAKADLIRQGLTFKQGDRTVATVLAAAPKRVGEVLMRTGDTVISVNLAGNYSVSAALQLECFLESTGDGGLRCVIQGPFQPSFVGAESVLPLPLDNTTVNFQVTEVHPPGDPVFLRVRARAITAPDIGVKLRVGDADSTMPPYPHAWIGRVESVAGTEVVLRLPAQRLANGWKYRTQYLKLGGGIRFETSSAVLNGTITDIAAIDDARQAGQ